MNARKLPLTFDADRLRADLRHVAAQEWLPHYEQGDYEGQWTIAPLRSIGGQSTQLRSIPRAHVLFQDTPILARCGYYQQVLTAFNCPLNAVRLLKLGAGSRIREHCDDHLSPGDGELRVHIPVQTNSEVVFFLAGVPVPMLAGECWFLNLTLPHSVENQSTEDRVHLVVDAMVNDWLAALLQGLD